MWTESVTPDLGGNRILDWGLLMGVQAVALLVLWKVGQALAGANPPRGIRGGIFLMISAAATIFFLTRRVGFITEEYGAGQVITIAVGVVLAFFAGRFFLSPRGERWMVGVEEQGWFHSHAYKRALGQKVRRLTILGFLLVGGSGVYSLMNQGVIPAVWTITLPFDGGVFPLIPEARAVVPVVLLGLTLWVAFRVVNMPAFAEFLIATEAEMNKVSWTGRKRLIQDTVVVLVTTLLMTVFLLAVDLFWGWLLSRETVGVLPSRSSTSEQKTQDKPLDW
jgi:preprotein translocase SecE subunit